MLVTAPNATHEEAVADRAVAPETEVGLMKEAVAEETAIVTTEVVAEPVDATKAAAEVVTVTDLGINAETVGLLVLNPDLALVTDAPDPARQEIVTIAAAATPDATETTETTETTRMVVHAVEGETEEVIAEVARPVMPKRAPPTSSRTRTTTTKAMPTWMAQVSSRMARMLVLKKTVPVPTKTML